jgi:hypothetical protein
MANRVFCDEEAKLSPIYDLRFTIYANTSALNEERSRGIYCQEETIRTAKTIRATFDA